MSTLTPNYEFKQPAESDFYNIADQNNNWAKADTELKKLDTKISRIAAINPVEPVMVTLPANAHYMRLNLQWDPRQNVFTTRNELFYLFYLFKGTAWYANNEHIPINVFEEEGDTPIMIYGAPESSSRTYHTPLHWADGHSGQLWPDGIDILRSVELFAPDWQTMPDVPILQLVDETEKVDYSRIVDSTYNALEIDLQNQSIPHTPVNFADTNTYASMRVRVLAPKQEGTSIPYSLYINDDGTINTTLTDANLITMLQELQFVKYGGDPDDIVSSESVYNVIVNGITDYDLTSHNRLPYPNIAIKIGTLINPYTLLYFKRKYD